MSLSRRRLLQTGAAGAAAVLAGTGLVSGAPYRAPRTLGDPFTLGVASGDPLPDGVVLWTRLAPDPFAPDGLGGTGRAPVTVEYEVAEDERFGRVVARGSAVATRELGHSVHPEVRGLAPDRWYFYRFRAGSAISPVGRTRTAPAPAVRLDRLRFAFVSCQHWSSGYYTAYRHLCDEDLDFVVHLGDYIYEVEWARGRTGVAIPATLRGEATDLTGYRMRYTHYKAEPELQDAHAAFPWVCTFDDHEIDNNWAGFEPGAGIDIYLLPALFRRRRAAAFHAMYENLPLRVAQLPAGPHMRMHRRYRFGTLADLTMLDTRQYRSPLVCGDGADLVTDCPPRFDPARTILGARQREWLIDGLTRSPARWQILGNQVTMAQSDHDPGPAVAVGTDAWDGYVADRNAVLAAAATRGRGDLVVLTGDRHENHVVDIRGDYRDPASPVVATEFTGTSITTGRDGADLTPRGRTLLAANPDMKFFNGHRGYVRVEVDREVWRSDFRVVPYVGERGAPITTRARFVVRHGTPGAQVDWDPGGVDFAPGAGPAEQGPVAGSGP